MSERVWYRDRRGRLRSRRKPRPALRAPGHKLTITWSGEYGIESSSTGNCSCGWQESASNQREVRFEYRHHLAKVLARAELGDGANAIAPDEIHRYWERVREIEAGQ